MQRKSFIFILCLVLNSFSFSQEKEKENVAPKEEKRKKPLPENIETFPKNFLVRPRFVYPSVSVNVSGRKDGRGEKFIYLPAMPGVVGLSLKIKKVYISAAVQLPASEALKKKYGHSKFRNINVNIRGRILQWGLFYRDYKGFYLANPNKHYPEWNVDSLGYPRSKGLRILETGLDLGFNFNKNFSLNAAFAQGERQKKSAGSFLMGLSQRLQRVNADTTFVPPLQSGLHHNLDKFKYGNFFTTLISFGFGYQLVVKKFHFTPVVMAGSGIQL